MSRFKKNTIYRKTLITSFTIISATILIISILTYIYVSEFFTRKSKTVVSSAFATQTYFVENILADINDFMFTISQDPFLETDFSDLSLTQKSRFNEYFFNKYNPNNAIASVKLYYPNSDMVVTPSYAATSKHLLNVEWLGLIETLPESSFNNKLYYSNDYVTRIIPFPYNSPTPIGYMAVDIYYHMLFQPYTASEDKVCVIDKDNNLAYGDETIYRYVSENLSSETPDTLTSLFDSPLRIGNEEYIISVIDEPGNSFIHFKGISSTSLFSEMRIFRNVAIIVAIIILIIAFLCYQKWFTALYKPIKSLLETYPSSDSDDNEFDSISKMLTSALSQKADMEKFYEKSKNALLQNSLLNLCMGNLEDEQYLIDALSSIGFPITGRLYTVAIASLNEAASKKISHELIFDVPIPGVRILSVCLHDNKMVFLINTPTNHSKIGETVSCIQNLINEHYKISCYFGIGNTYNTLTKYHISFREAMDALMYNVSCKSIVHINDCIPHGKNDKFYFTSELELQLSEAVKLSNIKDARMTFDEIYSIVSPTEYSPSFCSSILWQALNTLVRTFASMGYEYSDIYGCSLIDDFTKYSTLTDKKQMYDFVEEKIITAIEYIGSTHKHSNDMVVDKIKSYLDAHYMEALSLEILTDITGLSYPYLSSLFSSQTGETVIKYVTNKRMQQGAMLLRDTDINVNDISASLGYSTTRSFLNNFKAMYNLTPSEYRNQYRE